jgi:hypothetical protein
MAYAKPNLASRVAMEAHAANPLPSTHDGLISSMGFTVGELCAASTRSAHNRNQDRALARFIHEGSLAVSLYSPQSQFPVPASAEALAEQKRVRELLTQSRELYAVSIRTFP